VNRNVWQNGLHSRILLLCTFVYLRSSEIWEVDHFYTRYATRLYRFSERPRYHCYVWTHERGTAITTSWYRTKGKAAIEIYEMLDGLRKSNIFLKGRLDHESRDLSNNEVHLRFLTTTDPCRVSKVTRTNEWCGGLIFPSSYCDLGCRFLERLRKANIFIEKCRLNTIVVTSHLTR
jgi:hypothetical protein